MRRLVLYALVAALFLSGCGDGDLTLTQYVERVDAIFERGIQQYEALVTTPQGLVLLVGQGPHLGFDGEGAQLTDFSPQDLHLALERVAEIQAEALRAADAIDPPEQIADLHDLYFRELPIAQLAARAGTAADWEELSESPEMAQYRNALAADNQACADFQAKLDATADRGVFSDTPWLPNELTEIVDYALGCDSLPEHPEDVYRPPAESTP
ncbi:MAG: hypothetical protein GY720_18310 [bacterium]|nr:hypothetical protein [bacterium]